jgi:signal transduction histidine kinase
MVIGKVNIAFSTSGINSLIANITRLFIWVSFALALMAGLVFYVISRSIVLDVTRLADAVRKVGRGDLGLRTEPGSLPETRELALAFNTMLDSLATHREALVKANQEMARHQALAELGKFSLMIAHEVKNPLGIIKISFDFLKQDLRIPQDNTMVGYIEDEIIRLNGLIEEFLLFARPAKPTFRLVDLNGMAREMVDRFELQNMNSDVALETDLPQSPCEVLADPDLLTRALGNIVKNAYEANEGIGLLSIRARLEDRDWVLEVSDDGPGIPQENLEQVFEPFFTTKSKGTGLGLAFSKQILIAHQGMITARNRERGGVTFEIRIPIERGGE